jgi:tetratricopeptide (TPR) repeat protein
MSLRRALLIVPLLTAPAFGQTAWKKSWKEALAEAKKTNTCAVLLFYNDGVKDSKTFDAEALTDAGVKAALGRYVCARIDPEGPDEDNLLWQKHGMPRPPMTYIYAPDGTRLAEVRVLKADRYAKALQTIGPAYARDMAPARDLLAKNPEQADALARVAKAFATFENPVESAKHYVKAADVLAKQGERTAALKVLGELLDAFYEARWYTEAREGCRKILDLDAANVSKLCPKAAYCVGLADCGARKWNDAIAVLKPACDRYKDSPLLDKMMFTLGSAYQYNKDKQAAVAVYEALIKQFPETDSARSAQAQVDKLR